VKVTMMKSRVVLLYPMIVCLSTERNDITIPYFLLTSSRSFLDTHHLHPHDKNDNYANRQEYHNKQHPLTIISTAFSKYRPRSLRDACFHPRSRALPSRLVPAANPFTHSNLSAVTPPYLQHPSSSKSSSQIFLPQSHLLNQHPNNTNIFVSPTPESKLHPATTTPLNTRPPNQFFSLITNMVNWTTPPRRRSGFLASSSLLVSARNVPRGR
jgi:hypothetical protein